MSKITVKRNKKFVGGLVPLYIYVNGKEVAQVKNGKETSFELSAGNYDLFISKIHYVDGKAKNSGYGGIVGSMLEASNSAKQLNKTALEVKEGKDILVECEFNAVDCVILNIQ